MDDLWDMSDEELEAAVKEAKAQQSSPDTVYEEDEGSEVSTEETGETDLDVDTTETADDEEEADLEDGTEQLEADSDHDTSDEGTDEEESEEDGDADEATSSDDTSEDEPEAQPAQSHKFRASGKDYEFTSEEIVDQFPKVFGQAMDYTKKMQAIKPWRKTIDAIEGAELSHDDVSLMIDVLKGDKEAITEVLKRTGTDTLELDTDSDSNYVAKDYGRDDNTLAVRDIIEDIEQDAEYSVTQNILAKGWDVNSWNTMKQNPEMIRLLHTDVKTGVYDTLQPIAEKLKVYDGGKKSDLDYYGEAARQHARDVAAREAVVRQTEAAENERKRVESVKAQTKKRTAAKQASAKRKAAAPSKSVASPNVIDYFDDSDEAFEKWHKELQDKM